MIALTDTAEGMILSVKVVPGSSKTCLAGSMGPLLKIKVAAAPEKGKANDCLVDYLAELFGIRKNAVAILSGRTSPIKQICIRGVASEAARSLLDIKNTKN